MKISQHNIFLFFS